MVPLGIWCLWGYGASGEMVEITYHSSAVLHGIGLRRRRWNGTGTQCGGELRCSGAGRPSPWRHLDGLKNTLANGGSDIGVLSGCCVSGSINPFETKTMRLD